MILQDLITELAQVNCGGTRRRWKFYFDDLEIIRQMTWYFCDRNCIIICLHELSCKGEGAFCFVTFLSHVYLGGEDVTYNMVFLRLWASSSVSNWQIILLSVHFRYLEKSHYESYEQSSFATRPKCQCVCCRSPHKTCLQSTSKWRSSQSKSITPERVNIYPLSTLNISGSSSQVHDRTNLAVSGNCVQSCNA